MAAVPVPEGQGSGSVADYPSGVRLVVLNLPEDEGEGLGFRLTRTLWDPYPWVREVTPGGRADSAGLKKGDCLLQADGRDLLGMPVGQVAGLIRGDGAGRGVSLLAWNCGVDPSDDPELLWSCGGGARGERARRALGGVLRALACSVCAATAASPRACPRSHLYCHACWDRLERCALCREQLPSKDSPYARNLVAEQVFEAVATEYELKDTMKKTNESISAQPSPYQSPTISPSLHRRGEYQISMMNRHRKTVQFTDKQNHSYSSDPNIHRSVTNEFTRQPIPANSPQFLSVGNTGSSCQCQGRKSLNIPKINIEDAESAGNCSPNSDCLNSALQHKLVTRLRQACSMVDLQNANILNSCNVTRSLNNINDAGNDCSTGGNSASLENLKSSCDSPVFILPAQPIYVLACDHKAI